MSLIDRQIWVAFYRMLMARPLLEAYSTYPRRSPCDKCTIIGKLADLCSTDLAADLSDYIYFDASQVRCARAAAVHVKERGCSPCSYVPVDHECHRDARGNRRGGSSRFQMG